MKGRRRAVCRTLLAMALCLTIVAVARPGFARADGDPASDVLAVATQYLFLPSDAGASAAQQGQLEGLLAATSRAGVPIRLAVIASPSDLGSVTPLWGQPQRYAEFLGLELSLVYQGRLLIVMPNGFGLYEGGHSVTSGLAALDSARPAGTVAALPAAAIAAVERLAASGGVKLATVSAPATASSGKSSGDPVAWIAFVIGAALVAAAWIASIRARPLGSRRPAVGG